MNHDLKSQKAIYPSKLERLRAQANGYVVRNLQEYGNSLLPDSLIRTLGEDTTARLLTVIIGDQVSVFKRGKSWVAQR